MNDSLVKTNKIRVAWICNFSNEMVRKKLSIKIGAFSWLMWKLFRGHVPMDLTDRGVWNTNAIAEFEKVDNVDLHVIAACSYLSTKIQEFEHNGIHYHFFRDESSEFLNSIYLKIFKPNFYSFRKNRKIISGIIKVVQPDIVHMIGAENPQYSLSLLDISDRIPTIVQLQTLVNDPDFKDNSNNSSINYQYYSSVERKVILKADYIGTKASKYIKIIKESIKPNARILNTTLALGEDVNEIFEVKQFDFVYFASNIEKAGDIALEAFGIAYQNDNSITLDIVGGYSPKTKQQLDVIIEKYGIQDAVSFEGRLQTHDDVINQIRKSRYALLPLKIDLTSGCIREAMSNGLPVITTDTGELGTQKLNIEYRCALISPRFDCNDLANNMLLLLSSPELAEELRLNAIKRQREKFNNAVVVQGCVEAYRDCLKVRDYAALKKQ